MQDLKSLLQLFKDERVPVDKDGNVKARPVALISNECRDADGELFKEAYKTAPSAKGKTSVDIMAERLLKCWRDQRGDKEEGVGGLKKWMTSNPTEQVSRP